MPDYVGSTTSGLGPEFAYFVGFAGVVVYGPVAAEFQGVLGLSGFLLGPLVAAPQLTGSLLRIPFGAWVDDVGAKKPFAILLGLAGIGLASSLYRSQSRTTPTGTAIPGDD